MKVKKEVFESLRLELQEFAPQEFVAGCVILSCYGYGNGYRYIRTSNNKNSGSYKGQIDERNSHVVIKLRQEDSPSSPDLMTGYLWEGVNPNNGHGTGGHNDNAIIYFSYEGKYHITNGWESNNYS